ncbi:MAG: flagellar biosynthetic protein FliO [Planctomycetota bacterium]
MGCLGEAKLDLCDGRRTRRFGGAVYVLAGGAALCASAVFAQPNAAIEVGSARDGAVAAIQRARALSSQPADSVAAASDAQGVAEADGREPSGGPVAEPVATGARPLGAPSSTEGSTSLDRMSSVDGGGNGVLSTLSALGVVIGLVFVARWVLVRMKGAGSPGRVVAGTSSAVEVLTRVPIGNRQRVLLLRVGGRVVVVGDSGGGLTTLAEVRDEEEVADLLSAVSGESSRGAGSGFRDVFRGLAGGDEAGVEAAEPERSARRAEAVKAEESPGVTQTEVRELLSRVRATAAGLAGGRA